MRLLAALVSTLVAALSAATAARADPVKTEHLAVELVSERTALVPGGTAWLGLRLQHEPHWHTYWVNPGDSGLETRLKWTLPRGYSAGAIAWPAPRRLAAGDLTNFGYVDEIVLPVAVAVSADAKPGSRVDLHVTASWLVCEDICIPGKAELSLAMPVAATAEVEPRWRNLFASTRALIPAESGWSGEARMRDAEVEITLRGAGLPDTDGLDLFPLQGQLLEASRPEFERRGDALVARAPRSLYFTTAPERIELVLTRDEGDARRAWRASVPLIPAGPAPAPH